MEQSLKDFIRAFPKTETHLHIEGSLPWELLQKANPGKYLLPPASWKPDFRYDNFAHFENQLLGYAEIISIAQTAIMSVPNRFSPIASLAMFTTWRSASPRDALIFKM